MLFFLSSLIACGPPSGDQPGETCDHAFYADADGDGHGDATSWETACEAPSGYVATADDCDDASASMHPGAEETCNELDDDCDGTVDVGAVDASTWFVDRDADGFGDDASAIVQCVAPLAHVGLAGDCDDEHDAIHPGADEVCDEIDDDCDGLVDASDPDLSDGRTWYVDADGDHYGDPLHGIYACSTPDGALVDATDCDDANAAIHPSTAELCDGIDNDCDGLTDDADPDPRIGAVVFYTDADGDGFGDAGAPIEACGPDKGRVVDDQDCDDSDATVGGPKEFYFDYDRDGFGDERDMQLECEEPRSYTDVAGDCDTSDASIFPGAPEVCDDEDDNCDGLVDEDDPMLVLTTWYADTDGDGFGDPLSTIASCDKPSGYLRVGGDCDDGDSAIRPGATEYCDGVDNDCTGSVDDDVSYFDWYADSDGDGYGDDTVWTTDCVPPSGYTLTGGDCDDTSAATHPDGFDPYGDGIDGDCDGVVDDPSLDLEDARAAIVGDVDHTGVGWTISPGDFDDDGITDLLVGVYLASDDFRGSDRDGLAAIAYGPVTGRIDLDATTNITTTLDDTWLGYCVVGGDADGDGVDDALLTTGAGPVYLVLGPITADRLADDADAKLNSSDGYVLALVPDVDGDGTPDVVVPARTNSCDDPATTGADFYCGEVYVASGASSGEVSLDADATYRYESQTEWDLFGSGAGTIGDANGDGLADLALCASGSDVVYLIDGGASPGSYLASAAASGSIASGAVGDFGFTVVSSGDIDGDGYSDLVLGAPFVGTDDAGAVFAFLGPVTGSIAASDAEAVWQSNVGRSLGLAVTTGDVDGDGGDDILIGQPYGDSAYLQLGKAAGTIDVATLPTFGSEGWDDGVGFSVAILGDWSGDGWAELAVGANNWKNAHDDYVGNVPIFSSEQWLP